MGITLTTEEFIERAENVYGAWFDYSEVDYVGGKYKVKIGCPIHGFFWMTPIHHLRESVNGCSMCGIEARTKKMAYTTELFIKKAIKKYGDRFDYSRVDYVNNRTPIEIGCKEHGFFRENPNNHLQSKIQFHCPKCGILSRSKICTYTNEEFLIRAHSVHGLWYDYSEVDYVGYREKVKIGCPIHGWFWQGGGHHYIGHGCIKCARDKHFRNYSDGPTVLYYIKLTDLDGIAYWKIGITTQTLEKRFQKSMNHIEVLWTKPYSTGKKAYTMEQNILRTYEQRRAYNVNVSVIRGGWTELFTENVLHYVPVTWDGSLGVMPRSQL